MRRNIRNWGNDILRAAIILLVLFYACWPLRLSGGSMELLMKTAMWSASAVWQAFLGAMTGEMW